MNKIESPAESRKLLDKITFDLTRSIVKKDELTRFWFFILIMFAGVGLWGWIIQIKTGLGVTGLRDYVSWGMYIANFVFFVAVSLIGFLISSALHLLKLTGPSLFRALPSRLQLQPLQWPELLLLWTWDVPIGS